MKHYSFGFQDGISQPAVQDVDTTPNPGQQVVQQDVILLGRDRPNAPPVTRPPWALDGSFLCFRYLSQLVPEFNTFLKDNAIHSPDPSAPPDSGSELLGARLVGRWKSGTSSCLRIISRHDLMKLW
jgi:deferrochelatase/peroxidase EfeB